MEFNIYQVHYETHSQAGIFGIVSADSEGSAESVLREGYLEAFNKSHGRKIKSLEEISFKVWEAVFTGFKSDKKGVILF